MQRLVHVFTVCRSVCRHQSAGRPRAVLPPGQCKIDWSMNLKHGGSARTTRPCLRCRQISPHERKGIEQGQRPASAAATLLLVVCGFQ
jgi:hypothetical protein